MPADLNFLIRDTLPWPNYTIFSKSNEFRFQQFSHTSNSRMWKIKQLGKTWLQWWMFLQYLLSNHNILVKLCPDKVTFFNCKLCELSTKFRSFRHFLDFFIIDIICHCYDSNWRKHIFCDVSRSFYMVDIGPKLRYKI